MTSGAIDFVVLNGAEAQERWPEIRELIKHEFIPSQFNDGCDVWRPLESTHEAMEERNWPVFRHVIATDEEGKMVGGWFRIPYRRIDDETCSPGWFLTASALGSRRSGVADGLVVTAHEVMRSGGFSRIVTNMGTVAGARFLQRRHGYIHQPVQHKNNTWIKIL